MKAKVSPWLNDEEVSEKKARLVNSEKKPHLVDSEKNPKLKAKMS